MSEHAATYFKFSRGHSPTTGRTVYGTEIRCSCGWKKKTNERQRHARVLFNEHRRPSPVVTSA